jgi:CMP-N-acetylneuraminic acid synthetase
MKILGIIPARAGSKGIKDKNIYPLCGKPLIDWTLIAVSLSNIGDDFIISTDIPSIKHKFAYIRPKDLCQDDTKMIDVLKHMELIAHPKFDALMLLQPTSPLRTYEDINNAIELFEESGASSLYSGYYMGIKHKGKVYDKHTSEKHFQRNGAIFITKRELIEQGQLWDNTVIEYEMPLSRSIDIDTMDDMTMAEALLKYRAQGGLV